MVGSVFLHAGVFKLSRVKVRGIRTGKQKVSVLVWWNIAEKCKKKERAMLWVIGTGDVT
jgi:hypothetical protein